MFHNAEYIEASYIPGVSEPLQNMMADAWVSFARTGDPNHAGMPAWDKVSASGCPTMIFGTDSHVAVDHDRKLLDEAPKVRNFFQQFLKKKEEPKPVKPAQLPQGPQKK